MVELYSFFFFSIWSSSFYGNMDQTVISELGRSGWHANCGMVWSVQNETAKWFLDLLSLLFYKCWSSDRNQRMFSFIFKIQSIFYVLCIFLEEKNVYISVIFNQEILSSLTWEILVMTRNVFCCLNWGWGGLWASSGQSLGRLLRVPQCQDGLFSR